MIVSAGIGSGIDFESIIQASLDVKKTQLFNNNKETLDETISGYGKLESLIDKLKNYKDIAKVESDLDVSLSDACPTSLDIEVKQLAKPNTYRQSFSDGFVFSDFTIEIDGETKTIQATAGDTIVDIRDRVIAAGATASVIKKDGQNILVIEADNVTGLGSWLHSQGQDAIIEVNGIELVSKNNRFDNIEGLSFSINKIGNFHIKVTTESNFVDTYNSVIQEIKALVGSGEVVNGKLQGSGVLHGESYARMILRKLESTIQSNLANSGLELQKDGTLKINGDLDTSALQDLLKDFQYDDDYIIDDLRSQVLKAEKQEEINNSILADYEAFLRKKYAALDTIIARYNNMINYLI